MDFSWLEYIGNPYSVIAVIAAILGFSFKNLLKKIEKPKPQFILAMYGMFLISILAIGIGGMALVFFIKGEGASEMIANQQNHTFGFFRTAYAETGLSKTDASLTKIKINGWIWAGETTKVENKISETQTQSINKANSQILEVRTIPQKNQIVKTKTKANLRCTEPRFSWWRFHYQLGELIAILPANITLKVLETTKVGKNIWLKVEFER